MLKKVMYESYKHDRNCYDVALELYPDLLLHNSDEYLATLISSLVDESDPKTIFIVCGFGQSRTTPHYLYLSPRAQEQRLDQVAAFPPVYKSLLSKDTPEL